MCFIVIFKKEAITSKSIKNGTGKQIFQCFIATSEILCTILHRDVANKK